RPITKDARTLSGELCVCHESSPKGPRSRITFPPGTAGVTFAVSSPALNANVVGATIRDAAYSNPASRRIRSRRALRSTRGTFISFDAIGGRARSLHARMLGIPMRLYTIGH